MMRHFNPKCNIIIKDSRLRPRTVRNALFASTAKFYYVRRRLWPKDDSQQEATQKGAKLMRCLPLTDIPHPQKPEVGLHNILHCGQNGTEPWPQLTCKEQELIRR